MSVLDKLNESSSATAATLTAVRQAQEASLAIQKQTLENIVADEQRTAKGAGLELRWCITVCLRNG
jgi:hypothetical protein